MTGIEMMLKSLGLNPDEIKKQVAEFGQLVVMLNTKLDEILKRLDMVQQRIDGATVIKQTENGQCQTIPPTQQLEPPQPDPPQQPASL